jgi:hypothetical protein
MHNKELCGMYSSPNIMGVIKIGLAWLGCELSFNALVKYQAHQDNKKEETTPDCPATMSRGPGTTSPSRTPRLTAQP